MCDPAGTAPTTASTVSWSPFVRGNSPPQRCQSMDESPPASSTNAPDDGDASFAAYSLENETLKFATALDDISDSDGDGGSSSERIEHERQRPVSSPKKWKRRNLAGTRCNLSDERVEGVVVNDRESVRVRSSKRAKYPEGSPHMEIKGLKQTAFHDKRSFSENEEKQFERLRKLLHAKDLTVSFLRAYISQHEKIKKEEDKREKGGSFGCCSAQDDGNDSQMGEATRSTPFRGKSGDPRCKCADALISVVGESCLRLLAKLRSNQEKIEVKGSDSTFESRKDDVSLLTSTDQIISTLQLCHKEVDRGAAEMESSNREASALLKELSEERARRASNEASAVAVKVNLQKKLDEECANSNRTAHLLQRAQEEKDKVDDTLAVERRGRQDAEAHTSALKVQLEEARERWKNAEMEVSALRASLKNAADDKEKLKNLIAKSEKLTVKSRSDFIESVRQTNDVRAKAAEAEKQVKQLKEELETERRRTEAEAELQKVKHTEEKDAEIEEIEDTSSPDGTDDGFGLTQMVSVWSDKVHDGHGDDDHNRVGDLLSKARKLLEKSVNRHLRERFHMSEASVQDRHFGLMAKINHLRDRNFPPALISCMHEMRMMGNGATHGRETPSRCRAEEVLSKFSRLEHLFESGQLQGESVGTGRLPDNRHLRQRAVRWG